MKKKTYSNKSINCIEVGIVTQVKTFLTILNLILGDHCKNKKEMCESTLLFQHIPCLECSFNWLTRGAALDESFVKYVK